MDRYDVGAARELVEKKRSGERAPASAALLDTWRAPVERVFVVLDRALGESALPAEPPNERAIREWLINTRRSRLA
jgi:hypothetical protein